MGNNRKKKAKKPQQVPQTAEEQNIQKVEVQPAPAVASDEKVEQPQQSDVSCGTKLSSLVERVKET
jgi:hypothetical protein